MANTQPAQLSFSVEDELTTDASISVPAMVDPAMTVAQLAGAWSSLAALLDPVIAAQITGGRAILQLPMAGGKANPAAGSRVEQTGVFNFHNGVTDRRWGLAVPGLSSAVISAGRINLTDAGVAALLAALEGAITGGGVYTNEARQALTTLADAFISFRKRRRQLARSSFEL